MARSRQRQTSRRTNGRGQGRSRPLDNEGVIPILARAVREIESAVERGQAVSVRSRFQAVALLAREERIRVRTDTGLTEAKRDGELKRLDGIATILAQTAAREPSLFSLLAEDAKISDQASDMRRAMLERAGLEVEAETAILFIPGWLRIADLACHSWCRPLARVTGALVRPFMWLDRHVPAVRRHGYLLATVATKPRRDDRRDVI